jgi:hypothetical protein
MSGANTERQSALDLRANFRFSLRRLRILGRETFRFPQRSRLVQQARHFVRCREASPTIGFPLTRQRQMQTQVRIGMSLGVSNNFRDPGASHQDARRGDGAFVERVKAGSINRVRDPKIVSMDDQELCIRRVAKPFSNGFGLRRHARNE